jgi:hypothetical protein
LNNAERRIFNRRPDVKQVCSRNGGCDAPTRALTVSARWLSTLPLLAASLLVAPAGAAGRDSCPLTTRVSPYEATANARYEIVLADGGPGDSDGQANGVCDAAVRVCRGEMPLCTGAAMVSAKVRASGGWNRVVRHAAADEMASALAGLTTGDACRVARFSLAAEEDAGVAFRFRVATLLDDGRSASRRSRVSVRCVPAEAQSKSGCKTTKRGACPVAADPVCGNGIVDQAGEQCDGADAAACAGACSQACTCAEGPNAPQPPGVPSCGDGARNGPGERCDGADDASCPGSCRADCTCGTASGGLNVAPLAVATASSTDSATSVNAAVDGVVDGMPGQPSREWISKGEGNGAWLRLHWMSPVTIDRIVLHDRPNDVDNVLDAAVLVDDDDEPISTGPLPTDGAPAAVMFGPRSVSSVTIMVMQAAGAATGFAEVEAVATNLPPGDPTTPSQPTDPTPPVEPEPTGPKYYLSPTGSDSADGKSAATAWFSFAKAIRALQPGDTLVLTDGTYRRTTTGLPKIDCQSNAQNGTPDKPITIMAQHERAAHLSCDGIGEAVYMNRCSNWRLVGLRASSADNSGAKEYEGNVMRFTSDQNVQIKGALVSRPNRTCPNSSLSYCNAHAIAIEKSNHMLVEDSEIYDFHRHGVSAFGSRFITVRRCYMNPWDAKGGAGGGSTGVILYGSSDSIVENVVGEGIYGLNIAGGTTYDGSPGGYRNKILGVVTLNAKHGSTIRARKFSGPVLPAGDNLVKDSVFVNTQNVGVFARGVNDTVVENVSVFGTKVDAGVIGDQDLSEGAPCSANPKGCSITARNLLSIGNAGRGMQVDTGIVKTWSLVSSNLWGNKGGNFPTSETPGDAAGNIQKSESVQPTGMGDGGCWLWVPDGSNMKGAGADGRDIGASVLRRYQDGVLTTQRLWDAGTGAFPCRTVVPGVNDDPARSCRGVHTRLKVNTPECRFPAGY